MVFMERSDVYAQVIFAGRADRDLPAGPTPEGMCVTFSERSWCRPKTMVELVEFIDEKLNPVGERQPWILGLDLAPAHVCAETRDALCEKFPWVHKAYVLPKRSSCSQPLDLCYNLSFKRHMSAAAYSHIARQVDANLVKEGEVQVDRRLSILRPLLLMWIHEALGRLQADESLRASAWKYARTSSAHEFAAVLARATLHNIEGTLFRTSRTGVVFEALDFLRVRELQNRSQWSLLRL